MARILERLAGRLGAACREARPRIGGVAVLEAYLCRGGGEEYLVALVLAPSPPRRVRLQS